MPRGEAPGFLISLSRCGAVEGEYIGLKMLVCCGLKAVSNQTSKLEFRFFVIHILGGKNDKMLSEGAALMNY